MLERRTNAGLSFNKTWSEYIYKFGDLNDGTNNLINLYLFDLYLFDLYLFDLYFFDLDFWVGL